MKNEGKKSVKTRQLTICNKQGGRKNGKIVKLPIVVLSGKWLEESGFKPGHLIDVVCVDDCKLTITLAKEQRFDIG
ncbi:SymE family type I addiction module toxin [Flavobacterium branchiarum]|uniref:SymE family type I addiction module toxin n=1 Tax=Flavobacterium branchiarum TaxID=1114870 RepID=A0ABV5FS81_9FLAO|nr:SymE family type I addiction module toxin [Flavobacterium branchiarum]MDN3673468.1 SymE family type I addiction module toxin [Flavobacterium branchiarum]